MKKKYLSMITSMKTIFPKDPLDWFLWHKYLGFEHFYIIDDGCEPPLERTLEAYKDEITFFNIENKNKLRSHREIVREMYSLFRHETTWLAFMDEDEYLMPLGSDSIVKFLNNVEHKNAVYLQWRMFGPEGRIVGFEEDEIIMDEYRTYSYRNQGKMIVNCDTNGSRSCWQLNKVRKKPEYFKDYKWNDNWTEQTWTGKYRKIMSNERILIDRHDDRMVYLCNYILRNYYNNSKWNLVGEYAVKRINQQQAELRNSKGHDLPFRNDDIKVIINGHRYNLS